PPPPRPPSARQTGPDSPGAYRPRVESQASMLAPTLGTPGLSYRYVSTIGETDVPYVADTTHLNRPIGIYIDPATGDFFITEQLGKRLLKYNANKTNVLSIGKAGVAIVEDYAFNDPRNVSVAPDGHIWVADYSRLVEYTGAGDYVRDVSGADRWVTGNGDYEFDGAQAITFDGLNHMFVADQWNHRVQVYTWAAGEAPVYKTTLGVTSESGNDLNHLDAPAGVAATDSGQVFISDRNNNRVLICPFDSGTDQWTCTALTINLNQPKGLAYIAPDDLFIMDDGNGRIVKCDGTACATYASDMWGTNLAADSAGNLYVTREWDCVVDQIDPNGQSTGAFFGEWNTCYTPDNSHFNSPRVEIDFEGNMLILEEAGQRLLKFSPNGTFLWSRGQAGHDTWDDANFNWPHGLDTDKYGNIYVADGWRVKIYNKNGVLQNLIGTQPDQPNPIFRWVTDVAVDPNNGNIFIADNDLKSVFVYNSSRVKIGQVGETNVCGSDNQHFCGPVGVDVDANSNLYVTDWGNARVQKYNSQRQYVK
ncbi:MAG: hypothetical protein EHM21_17010, partial [Chloroflexi bacterium]